MNSTSKSQDPLGRSPTLVGMETLFAVTITIASLLSNSLVIYVVHKDSRLRSITNVFIESLAWSDVCMSISKMPFWVTSIINGRWTFNEVLCPWTASLMFTFGICSILTMGLIAVNRYFKVVRNASYSKYFKNRRVAGAYCLAAWAVAILLATPPLYGWGAMKYHDKFSLCTMLWDLKHISYVVVVVGGAVSGTTVVIFICYYKIYKAVKLSTANINTHQTNRTASHTTDIKLLKTTFTVVCIFLATWMPVSFVVVYETAGGSPPRLVLTFVIYLMFTSSCVNPIIYGILNPRFRRAFMCVFKCHFFGNNDNDSSMSVGTHTTGDIRIHSSVNAVGNVEP